jgi:hypothetical protein
MTRDEELISAASSAYRARDASGALLPDAAWMDLDVEGRRAAFEATVQQRRWEAALADDGLSSTARAVLARLGASI